MAHLFSGPSADDVWQKSTTALGSDEKVRVQDSRAGRTRELLHVMLRIEDPRRRWVLSRSPGINPAFAIAEAFWILAGRNDSAFVNFWNPALPRFAGTGSTYHGAYGARLRGAFGLDQVERAIQALQGQPDSRQVVLQIWDPRIDFPSENGKPVAPDVPCNICSLPKIRDGRLEWMQIMRSNDVYRGTPYNLVQFTIVQEYMAGCLGLEVGDYVHVADSLHCYETDLSQFTTAPGSISAKGGPRLSLPLREAKEALHEIIHLLEVLASSGLTKEQFNVVLADTAVPPGHQDLLCIAAADSARRRGWTELQAKASDRCLAPDLLAAWRLWEEHQACAQSRLVGSQISSGTD